MIKNFFVWINIFTFWVIREKIVSYYWYFFYFRPDPYQNETDQKFCYKGIFLLYILCFTFLQYPDSTDLKKKSKNLETRLIGLPSAGEEDEDKEDPGKPPVHATIYSRYHFFPQEIAKKLNPCEREVKLKLVLSPTSPFWKKIFSFLSFSIY